MSDRPVLVVEGDSWLRLPIFDLTDALRTYDLEVVNCAVPGDTAESIFYERQSDEIGGALDRLVREGRKPSAFLLSCGGNDLVNALPAFINHARSGLDPLRADVACAFIAHLTQVILALSGMVSGLMYARWGDHDIPIYCHGYDYSTPDGRGFLGRIPFGPGPWLRPIFAGKGYAEDDQRPGDALRGFLDEFNAQLATTFTTSRRPRQRYLDLRGTLNTREDWHDEIHPNTRGFKALADGIVKRFRLDGIL
jgi:hypothetical protein